MEKDWQHVDISDLINLLDPPPFYKVYYQGKLLSDPKEATFSFVSDLYNLYRKAGKKYHSCALALEYTLNIRHALDNKGILARLDNDPYLSRIFTREQLADMINDAEHKAEWCARRMAAIDLFNADLRLIVTRHVR